MFLADPDWVSVGLHTIMPSIKDTEALSIAIGMLGATVMPHVIFLHSQLVQARNGDRKIIKKKRHLRMEKIDIVIAMNIAFIVNSAMVIVAASVFYKEGLIVDSIELAHKSLTPLLGTLSSIAFGIALLASGLSSSAVGAMAGESVMDGFINIKLSPNIKRLITMLPAMLVIVLGINPMRALVYSQMCLSFVLPMAIIPLIIITSNKNIMKSFVNTRIVKIIGIIITLIIIILNLLLIFSSLINIF
jgi:manganese transport protein